MYFRENSRFLDNKKKWGFLLYKSRDFLLLKTDFCLLNHSFRKTGGEGIAKTEKSRKKIGITEESVFFLPELKILPLVKVEIQNPTIVLDTGVRVDEKMSHRIWLFF